MTYQSLNPFDGKLARAFDPLGDAALDAKIAAAHACYATWRHTSYAQRAAIIAKAGQILHQRADALARIATQEMGKRLSEARGEVEFSAQIMAYYAQHAERFLAPVPLHPTHGHAHMESSPIGVIYCIEPWNFPYYQLARVAGPQLMAGNTLLVKHAEIVPQCPPAG